MDICINTTHSNLLAIIKVVQPFGIITDQWPDGSFNFQPHSDESYETVIELLDDNEVRYENL